mgnify:CR=1 FL=1
MKKFVRRVLGDPQVKTLKRLRKRVVSINALEEKPLFMKDYVEELDSLLNSSNRKLLSDNGKISHQQAMEKARKEFKEYQNKSLSEVEKAYLENLNQIEKVVKKKK